MPTGLFINNEFVPSVDGLTLDVENPATGETLTTIASASANDIDRAVAAAQVSSRSPLFPFLACLECVLSVAIPFWCVRILQTVLQAPETYQY